MSRKLSPILIAALTAAVLTGCGVQPRVASIAQTATSVAPKAKATSPKPKAVDAPSAKSQARPFLTEVGAREATFAPDGAYMVFSAGREGVRDLVIARPDGSQPRALLEGRYDDVTPAWSPSGEWLAFVRRAGAQGDTLVRHHMGRGQSEAWLKSKEPLADPAWLPGDRGVVFFSGQGSTSVLYHLDARGGSPVALWRGTGGASPTVAADGATVVFEAVTAKGRALFRVGLADGEAQPLKVEGQNPRQPSFSPTGQSIAYVADGGLYVARADGSAATRLAAGSGFSAPRWNPRQPQVVVTAESGVRTDLQAIALPQR